MNTPVKLQLAILHGGGANIVGIEIDREVPLYAKLSDFDAIDEIENEDILFYTREVDIMTGTRESAEAWWELKSWKSASATSEALAYPVKTPWGWRTGIKDDIDDPENKSLIGSSAHKQFTLDRVAKKLKARIGKKERRSKNIIKNDAKPTLNVSYAFWQFHKFKNKGQDKKVTSQNPSVSNLKNNFLKEPTGKKGIIKAHTGPMPTGIIKLGALSSLLNVEKMKLKAAIQEDLINSGFE